MSDTRLNVLVTAKDQASGQINKLRKNVTALGGPKFGPLGNMVGGLATIQGGAFAAAAGVTALAGATVAAGRAIGGATMAAALEQVQIAKLDAALEANIKGWDGNTAAIERRIQQAEFMAFTDDELRQSLALTVIATGNVDKAWSRVTLAMDVARAKSISLSEASTLLNKAALGNTRALKDLGIQIKSGSSEAEIFAAIQTKVAGQAQKYADTAIGSMETLGNIAGDLEEEFGAGLLPAVTQGSKDGAVALNDLRGSARGLGEDMGALVPYMAAFVKLLPGVSLLLQPRPWDASSRAGGGYGDMGERIVDDIDSGMTDAMRGHWTSDAIFRAHLYGYGVTAAQAGEVAGEKFGQGFTDDLVGTLRSNKGTVRDIVKDITWTLTHPGKFEREIKRIQKALSGESLQKLLGSDNPVQRAIGQQLQGRLQGLLTGLTGPLGTAADAGKTAWTDYANSWNASLNNPPLRAPNWPTPPGVTPSNFPVMGHGGPVSAGESYIVGDRGPEVLTMGNRGGHITPNNALGGVPPHSHPIYIKGRQVFEAVDEEMGRRLSRSPAGAVNRG